MKNKMTAADWLAERARIEQAASEGPWEHEGVGEIIQHFSLPEPATIVSTDVACMGYCYGGSAAGVERDEDAEFIADARTALPKALDALEAVLALHRLHVCGEVPLLQMERGACFIGHDGCLSVGTCRDCKMPYPCPTVAVITEALT